MLRQLASLVAALLLACNTVVAANCVKILSAGDWGTTEFGNELSAWMDRVAGSSESLAGCPEQASALLLLGDNFYDWGVSSTTDSLWTTIYENPFNRANLQAIPQHWATAGNHDHYSIFSGTSAQKAYTTSGPANSKWTFPSDYYTKVVDQNGIKVFFVITESWNLVGGDSWLPFQSLRIDRTQLQWIEAQLASSEAQSADWLIVVGHYPIRSIYTSFGRGDTEGLVRELEPLLKKYSVDAYISGHDHFHWIIDRKHMGYPVYYGNGASGKRDKGDVNYNKFGLNFVVEDSLGFHSHVFTKTHMLTTIHYKFNDGIERTHTFIQEKNTGPSTPFDCEQFSCGATCDQYKEFGCAWSSTADPPKFKGPGGSGTCVLDFGKDTTFWEKNDGICTAAALAQAQVLATDEAMLAQNLTPGQVAGAVLGTLAVLAFIVGMIAVYRRRHQIKNTVVRISQRLSSQLPRRQSSSSSSSRTEKDRSIVLTPSASSTNPGFVGAATETQV